MKILAILIGSCAALIHAQDNSSIETLRLVQVTFRHGDRTPAPDISTMFYPLDPYANETWYPVGQGSVTITGRNRSYQLGVFLRGRYGEWLGDVYSPDRAVFRSSTTHRTIISAQLVAAGLFPPSEIERWHPNLDWQPIPVYSDPVTTAMLYVPDFMCEKLRVMRMELEQKDENLLRRDEELKEFFNNVSINVGMKLSQRAVAYMWHHFSAVENMGVKLPEWIDGMYPEGRLQDVAIYDYYIQSHNKTMIRLHSGRWIGEWLKNVDEYLSGSRSEPKAVFYGAHETNIAGILITLGVFEPHIPFYSNAVIFELSQIGKEYYVKVLYKNRDHLQELVIPGCGGQTCLLVTFRQLFADVISFQDPVVECRVKDFHPDPTSPWGYPSTRFSLALQFNEFDVRFFAIINGWLGKCVVSGSIYGD